MDDIVNKFGISLIYIFVFGIACYSIYRIFEYILTFNILPVIVILLVAAIVFVIVAMGFYNHFKNNVF